MKILFATGIYPPDAGGPATYTRTMARALSSQGHEIQVVAYGEKDGVDEKDGYPVERIGRNTLLPLRYKKFEDAVYRRAREADIVYLQGPVSEGFPGIRAAKRAKKPTVMKVVGDYAWEIYAGNGGVELLDHFIKHRHTGKIRLLEWIERWSVNQADRVIVPSPYLETVVIEHWKRDRATTHMIPNAAEPLPDGQPRGELRRHFGIEDRRVMLTAVRAVPWKACDFIIKLLPDLPDDVLFVLAGDGPLLEDWKQLAVTSGVADRVRFLGKVDRASLADWYRAADLFVLPSSYEGFANVIPEAVSTGLPVLASHIVGNADAMEYFGPDVVRLAAYQSREEWLSYLKQPWPKRQNEAFSPKFTLTVPDMVEKTLEVLKGATL